MKKTILPYGLVLSIMLMVSFFNINAQRHHPGHHTPPNDSTFINKMVENMSEELSLTEEQKKEIKELHLAHFKKVRDEMKDDREKNRDEMEKMKEKLENSVLEVLNDEQKERYKKYMKELGDRGRHRPVH